MQQAADFVGRNKKVLTASFCIAGIAAIGWRTRGITTLKQYSQTALKSEQHGKYVAYIFASRALWYSTGLVSLSSLLAAVALGALVGADSPKQFAEKTHLISQRWGMHVGQGNRDGALFEEDEALNEFMREVDLQIEADKNMPENPKIAFISHAVQNKLGITRTATDGTEN